MSRKTHPLKTLYRMVVMAGVLGVGSMAAYLYGPAPERLAEMINETADHFEQDTLPTEAATEAPLAFIDRPSASQISPSAVAPPEWTPPGSTEQLVASIKAAGASDAKIESWGSSGELYRASAEVRVGEMVQHYDLVSSSPEQGAADLIELVQQASFER